MESFAKTIATILLATLIAVASSQQIPSCGQKLIPCAQYLNSTTPPATCCGPLKDALTNDLACLCNIFNNPDVLKGLNIDPAAALKLPAHCGMTNFTTNACKASASAPGSPAFPPPPPSPATPGASNRVSWMGMPGIIGAFFVLFSILG